MDLEEEQQLEREEEEVAKGDNEVEAEHDGNLDIFREFELRLEKNISFVGFSPYTIHHSPLTIHHYPFTCHHSPLTI